MTLRYGILLASVVAAACQAPPEERSEISQSASDPTPASNPAPEASDPKIVFLGTSLTAGYGLADPSQAYPALIQARLDSLGYSYRVVNAGISGETSAGALRRIDWLMGQGVVAVLFVETGANDGLRGLDLESLKLNIDSIIARARLQDPPPRVIIAGMEALPNLGRQYTDRFREVYPAVARSAGVALVPFLLEGVAGVPALNQSDGIHPTAEGQRKIAELIWPFIEKALPRRR